MATIPPDRIQVASHASVVAAQEAAAAAQSTADTANVAAAAAQATATQALGVIKWKTVNGRLRPYVTTP
nr:MAG TPA_asm: hypothetical protein [Caudoviricetes sp.]